MRRTSGLLLLAGVLGAASAGRAEDYRIAPGDTLSVFLNGELSLKMEQVVGPDGAIAVQYAGRVRVDGLTPEAAQESIRAELERRKVYSGADVMLAITGFRPIFVSGMVEQAGSFPYAPGTTVGRAVAMAGGPLNFGSLADSSPGMVIQLSNASADLTGERRAYLRATLAAQRIAAQLASSPDPGLAAPAGLRLPQDVIDAAVGAEQERFRLLEMETRQQRQLHVDSIQLLEVEVATVEARKLELELLAQSLTQDLTESEAAVGRGALIQSAERELRYQSVIGTIERNLSLARIDLLETDRNLTVARQRLVEERADQQSFENERTLNLSAELAEQSDAEAQLRDRITALESQMAMAPGLLSGSAPSVPEYVVERLVDGAASRMTVDESFLLLPGDLLLVSTQMVAN